MKKYHVNAALEPGKCTAIKGKCPFGGADAHFTSFEAAKAQSERLLEEAHGWSSKRQLATPPAEALPLMEEINKLERNPALHNYGFPEDEMIRGNIQSKISEKKKELRALVPHGEFLYNRFMISPADEAKAVSQLVRTLQSKDPKYSWESVMGGRKRKTQQNIQGYYSHLENMVKMDPVHAPELRKLTEQARDASVFQRTHAAGEKAPQEYEDAFDDIWSSEGKMSERWVREELTRLDELEDSFNRGEVKPSTIVGSGLKDPNGEAVRYLRQQRQELKDALKSEGRSLDVNVRNVYLKAKREGWPYSQI